MSFAMPYEFYLGLDAHRTDGHTRYTAALIEKGGEADRAEDAARYRVHLLKRYEDEAPSVVADEVLSEIANDPFTGRTILVVNVGEKAGRELRAALRGRGASPISLSITGGDTSSEQGRPLSFSTTEAEAVHVSEREIVSSVEDLYRNGRLEVDAVMDDIASALVQGLEAYQVESDVADVEDDLDVEDLDVEDADQAETNVRAGTELRSTTDHADLVLAAGAGCWLARQHRFDPTEHLGGPPPPVREPKREMRPDTGKRRTPAQ